MTAGNDAGNGVSTLLDQAGDVRTGEELDIQRIDTFLKTHIEGLIGLPTVQQFPGGASNLTYLLQYPQRSLILRRPPFGHRAKSAHDMLREARIMSAVKPVYPYVPTVLATCEDRAVMDCDFYVMEQIRGIIPRQNLPTGLNLSESQTRQLCINVIDRMIELHQVDYRKAGLEGLGRGGGYVVRQIEGWSDRYRKAKTPDVGDFEQVMAFLKDKMPQQDVATCLIHNDFRFDNVVLNPDNPFEVIGVLDWEMATLGDPLMDLGNTLAYWVQADDDDDYQSVRRQPTNAPGMMSRQEVIEYYGSKTGWQVDNFDFYLIYGLFRLAVIVQQIYFRYFNGDTKNKAFANFGFISRMLEKRCLRLIDASRL